VITVPTLPEQVLRSVRRSGSRSTLSELVAQIVAASGLSYAQVNARLNHEIGIRQRDVAGVEQLRFEIDRARDWLARLRLQTRSAVTADQQDGVYGGGRDGGDTYRPA
jgi:hypothetical protein